MAHAYIQNSAAHIVTSASKYDHTSPILQNLPWLSVDQRIQFKVSVTKYKAVNSEAAKYLCDLVSLRWPSRALRSCGQLLLDVPVSRLKSYRDCVFCVAGSTSCYGFPEQVQKSSSLENVNPVLRAAFSVK